MLSCSSSGPTNSQFILLSPPVYSPKSKFRHSMINLNLSLNTSRGWIPLGLAKSWRLANGQGQWTLECLSGKDVYVGMVGGAVLGAVRDQKSGWALETVMSGRSWCGHQNEVIQRRPEDEENSLKPFHVLGGNFDNWRSYKAFAFAKHSTLSSGQILLKSLQSR